MKAKIGLILIISFIILVTVVYAADVKWSALAANITVADDDVLCIIDTGTATSQKITVLDFFDTIDSLAKLNTIVGETLVSEEGTPTLDALWTFDLGLTITTGDDFIIGTTQWNSADEIDGTKIKDADYGDIDVSAGGVWTLDTDVVDVDALDQTISPTLTGRWTFAGEDTGTDVIGLNVNWAGSDPTNGQSEGDFWYDSTLNVYKGYTTHEIILGSAEEPGIIQAKKGSAGTISAGDAVYISGFDGTDLLIEFADADDSSKMPAIGIAAATINSGTAGSVTTFGLLEDIINTGGMSVGDGIWITVTGTTGNTLTNTKPTGATTAIQRIATVASSAASGELFVAGALRTNDESNLTEAYIFVGNSSQNSTAVAMSGDVAIIANGTTAIQTNAVALTTDTTGNYSNGNAEAGDALVSIAVEITDNENTAENNPIVFVAGAAQTGGDLGLETDGDLYYNPSTGTVTTTVFVENGNAVISEAVATAGLIFGDSTPDADGEIAFDTTGDGSTVTAGVIDIYDGTEVVHYFGSAGYPTGDNQILKYDAGTNKVIWEVDAGAAGGDEWGDAVDSDILPTGNDNIYDLGSVAASFKDGYFQGTLEAGILTEGGNAVWNSTETDFLTNEHIDWANIDYLADEGALTVVDSTYASTYVAIFDGATGNLQAKTDGALTYDATSGTLATTQFSGGGGSLTGVDAATGDNAGSFFDAGVIEHERGGLEADISGYTGLVAITGGATAEVDSKTELEGHIADVADFAEADGDTWTGTHDLSGATVTMPKRTKNDDRFYLFNAWNPNALYDTDTQLCIEPNLPANITITEVTITLDADPTTELDWDLKWADAFIGLGTATLIVAIDTTNGTTDVDSGFSDATVVAGKCLYIEFAADPDSNIKQAIVKIRYDFD